MAALLWSLAAVASAANTTLAASSNATGSGSAGSNATAAAPAARLPTAWYDDNTISVCSLLTVVWLGGWALGLYVIRAKRNYMEDRANCVSRHLDRSGSVVLERGEMEHLFWRSSTSGLERNVLLLVLAIDGVQQVSCALCPTVTWGTGALPGLSHNL